MTNRLRSKQFLAASLLAVLAGTSPGGEPASRRSEVKFPAFLSAKPLQPDPKDDELRKLLKERYNAALAEARDYYAYEQLVNGRPWLLDGPDAEYARWNRLVDSGLELCDKPADKVALLTKYLELAKDTELVEKLRSEAGERRAGSYQRAKFERLQAEIRLLRAKREAASVKPSTP